MALEEYVYIACYKAKDFHKVFISGDKEIIEYLVDDMNDAHKAYLKSEEKKDAIIGDLNNTINYYLDNFDDIYVEDYKDIIYKIGQDKKKGIRVALLDILDNPEPKKDMKSPEVIKKMLRGIIVGEFEFL